MLAPSDASLVQPVISSVVKDINGREFIRAGRGSMERIYIEINSYFSYEPKFNDVFSRNNLPLIRNGAYVINLHDEKGKGTHWVSLTIDRNTTVYFDSFVIENIPLE